MVRSSGAVVLDRALTAYAEFKLSLGKDFGFGEDLLQVHAGLLIFFVGALLFKRRMRSRVPIILVYLFAIGNEVIDVFSPGSARDIWEPPLDVLNTVLWPTLLFSLLGGGHEQAIWTG